MSCLTCRFYIGTYPTVLINYFVAAVVIKSKSFQVGQVVMINVRSINGEYAYINLLEYNDFEIVVKISDLIPPISNRNHSKRPLTPPIGKPVPAIIQWRDFKNRRIMGLSMVDMSFKNKKNCTKLFARSMTVFSILRQVGDILKFNKNYQLENLYKMTAWHFEKKYKFRAAAFVVFKNSIM